MNHFVQRQGATLSNDAASSRSFLLYLGQNGKGTDRMAAAQVERPFERQLNLRAERRVVAGVVRSRTAASWQRNSQTCLVPQRRLQGSPDARFGSVAPVGRMKKPPFAVA